MRTVCLVALALILTVTAFAAEDHYWDLGVGCYYGGTAGVTDLDVARFDWIYLCFGNIGATEETVAGIKRQHNILAQLGIDPQKEYGYRVIEPLAALRKDGVREVARLLDMPPEMCERIPFPGPALATRIVGEVTEERLATVRAATAVVEEELGDSGAFQYMAVLLADKATGIRDGRREFGQIIVVRCLDSVDARTATAVELPWEKLHRICGRITSIEGVNRCLYDLTPKPPATIEYV